MFKLKLINKPKMIKLKCGFSFPNIVLANLQEKEVIPTKEKQEVIVDNSYDGLSKVIVNPIPDEYIIPTGELEIIQNGTYDVSSKASAKVNVPEKVLGTKTITTNGTYKAIDDGLDGYSEVNVSTSGVDINDYYDLTKRTSGGIVYYIKQIPMIDTSDYTDMTYMFNSFPSLITIPQLDTGNVNNMYGMFYICQSLKTIPQLNTSKVSMMAYMFYNCQSLTTIPQLDTSKATNMSYMFQYCQSLTTIPQLDTSKATNMSYMFSYCQSLTTIPQLDTSKATSINGTFVSCYALTTLGGFTSLGQAYDTTKSANYSNYTLDLHYSNKLTHDSLMNVINNLYDIATKGCKPQQLVLGSANLAKLTSEEIAIVQNKGWNLS